MSLTSSGNQVKDTKNQGLQQDSIVQKYRIHWYMFYED